MSQSPCSAWNSILFGISIATPRLAGACVDRRRSLRLHLLRADLHWQLFMIDTEVDPISRTEAIRMASIPFRQPCTRVFPWSYSPGLTLMSRVSRSNDRFRRASAGRSPGSAGPASLRLLASYSRRKTVSTRSTLSWHTEVLNLARRRAMSSCTHLYLSYVSKKSL